MAKTRENEFKFTKYKSPNMNGMNELDTLSDEMTTLSHQNNSNILDNNVSNEITMNSENNNNNSDINSLNNELRNLKFNNDKSLNVTFSPSVAIISNNILNEININNNTNNNNNNNEINDNNTNTECDSNELSYKNSILRQTRKGTPKKIMNKQTIVPPKYSRQQYRVTPIPPQKSLIKHFCDNNTNTNDNNNDIINDKENICINNDNKNEIKNNINKKDNNKSIINENDNSIGFSFGNKITYDATTIESSPVKQLLFNSRPNSLRDDNTFSFKWNKK